MGEFSELGDFVQKMGNESRKAVAKLDYFDGGINEPPNQPPVVSDDDVFPEAAEETEAITRSGVRRIMRRHLLEAIEANPEYSLPEFKDRLLRVFGLDAMFYYSRSYYFHSIYVYVQAEDIAGNVEVYMEAVRNTRPKREADEHSSFIWREVIYKTAREGRKFFQVSRRKGRGRKKKYDRTEYIKALYNSIIAARLDRLSYSEAPFWHFLNYGVTDLQAEGDSSGGTPYPISVRTDFVENAEREINTFVNEELRYQMDYLKKLRQQEYETVESQPLEEDMKIADYLEKAGEEIVSQPEYTTGWINQAILEQDKKTLAKKRQALYRKFK